MVDEEIIKRLEEAIKTLHDEGYTFTQIEIAFEIAFRKVLRDDMKKAYFSMDIS